jgi:hypothetical protein
LAVNEVGPIRPALDGNTAFNLLIEFGTGTMFDSDQPHVVCDREQNVIKV